MPKDRTFISTMLTSLQPRYGHFLDVQAQHNISNSMDKPDECKHQLRTQQQSYCSESCTEIILAG